MSKVDRRIQKTQEALKKAIIELMSEKEFDDITIQDISDRANVSRGTIYLHYQDKFDLLDRLIAEHIKEMRDICESTSDMEYKDANLPWFEYLEKNHLFFSTMLKSKGAPSFRSQFLEFLIEEFQDEVNVKGGKNRGLNADVILQFIVTSYVGMVEWWIANGMPYSPHVMAEQVGILLERNL
ncbi:TetR/AcrR family transcriptional regulator [Paenibacillus aurantius]|uniref:TetR/AcrR family transcriptional regulator n=1 Tax=Paenibacillus aurantius TaxID=2918900 RepID=A0AA96LGI4_9BACL|nr:TetR/AcrR family transcriptional regulator [Paenibacillus aurantius]WNQ12863.1 TetR/AcrR family transcriptional regulator [Paenibacillus aurantius]